MQKPRIGFAGMTHLGLNSAVATAEHGFSVLGFDADAALISDLQIQKLPILEPLLPELLTKHQKNIQFSDTVDDLFNCDIVYIAADVPTNDNGQSNLQSIIDLIQTISQHLNSKAILVILCQVPPGFCRQLNKMISLSRIYYQVETLIFGQAMERALSPERFIIGSVDLEKPLPAVFQMFLEAFHCPILRMRYESAELAKIAINCCLVSSIAMANTLSEICEKIGADWSDIAPALKLDKRIGQHAYLSPGLGIAGGNLERDLHTVITLSQLHGTDSEVISACIKNGQYRRDWVLKILHEKVFSKNANPLIAVLGLAYKENTHSIKNSPAVALLSCLHTYRVRVFDPVVSASHIPHATGSESMLDAIEDVDVLIIMTPWEVFRSLKPKNLTSSMKGRVIIDPYHVLDHRAMEKINFQYFTLGNATVC